MTSSENQYKLERVKTQLGVCVCLFFTFVCVQCVCVFGQGFNIRNPCEVPPGGCVTIPFQTQTLRRDREEASPSSPPHS